MSTPGRAAAGLNDECFYCRRAAGLEGDPAGGWVYEDEHFRVGHADVGIACAGSFVVEARRHVLDIGGMTGHEIASLMALLPKLYRAMHEGLGAERVYLLATEAFQPHFHAWLYPWRTSAGPRGIPFLAQAQSCTSDEAIAALGEPFLPRRAAASPGAWPTFAVQRARSSRGTRWRPATL